jgi:hypothetical protein
MKIVSVILDDTQESEEGNRTQDSEQDVDAEVNTTATVKQDTEGWEDDGNEELADITESIISHVSLRIPLAECSNISLRARNQNEEHAVPEWRHRGSTSSARTNREQPKIGEGLSYLTVKGMLVVATICLCSVQR